MKHDTPTADSVCWGRHCPPLGGSSLSITHGGGAHTWLSLSGNCDCCCSVSARRQTRIWPSRYDCPSGVSGLPGMSRSTTGKAWQENPSLRHFGNVDRASWHDYGDLMAYALDQYSKSPACLRCEQSKQHAAVLDLPSTDGSATT